MHVRLYVSTFHFVPSFADTYKQTNNNNVISQISKEQQSN